MFLTPRSQQTFVWYAGRGQVVNWKDMPQDAASLVAWSQRMSQVYPPVTTRGEWTHMSDRQLEQLAEQYGADYLVLDRTRHVSRKGLTRVYPAASDSRSAYQVYQFRLPPQSPDPQSPDPQSPDQKPPIASPQPGLALEATSTIFQLRYPFVASSPRRG